MVTFNSSMDSTQSPQSDGDQFYNSSSPSSPGVPIAAIIAVGFFATSLVITIYYLLVVKFWLNNQHRSRAEGGGGGYNNNNNNMPPMIFFSYDTQEAQGVHPSVVSSIPIVTFRKGTEDVEDEDEEKKATKKGIISSHECAVCLADFLDKERIKVLPGCSHAFHVDCIDTWLQFNVNCPMCRSVISCASLAMKVTDQTELGQADQTEDDRQTRELGRAAHREADSGVRRSFSMDWFAERRIKRSGEGSTSGTAGAAVTNGETSGRFMRLVHSFRLGRSSRNAVLPIQMEPHD